MDIANLTERLAVWGANRVAVIPVAELVFDAEFRKACEVNSCGIYGRCWMCPPDVGEIHTLMKQAMRYQNALVYQTISPLEDSYDIEGMQLAAKRHVQLTLRLKRETLTDSSPHLHLSAGGCHVCEKCTKLDQLPCRFPELALPSLEAYGINVSKMASAAGMKYINGANTVTYFSAMLYGIDRTY